MLRAEEIVSTALDLSRRKSSRMAAKNVALLFGGVLSVGFLGETISGLEPFLASSLERRLALLPRAAAAERDEKDVARPHRGFIVLIAHFNTLCGE